MPVAGRMPLRTVVDALRRSGRVERIVVVGPAEIHAAAADADELVAEHPSGHENLLAGLAAAQTRRVLVTASDLPFVAADHISELLDLVAEEVAFAYPIYRREEFLAHFPAGRRRFARADGAHWTGGSLCVVDSALAQRHRSLIRKGFESRKSVLALASLFGVGIALRALAGSVRITDVERRLSRMVGAPAQAIRGAHPALAMDCDDAADLEYARRVSGDLSPT